MLHQFTDRSTRRSPAFLALAAGSLGVAALAAPGLAQTAQYGPVTHEFDIETKGTAAPRLVFSWDIEADAMCDENEADDDQRDQKDVDESGASEEVKADADTVSRARASVVVKELDVGKASGEYSVSGDVTLCVPDDEASGRAKSWAQLSYIGQTKTPQGKIIQRGHWKNEPAIKGDTGKKRVKDPIVVRITDLTSGDVVREWTALTIENFVHGGAFEWENNRVVNRAPTMDFEITFNDGVSRPSTLRLATEFGVVTESVATGVFAGAALPPAGSPSDFEFDLANEVAFSFDAGLPSTDRGYQVEVEMSSAGEADAAAGAGGVGGGGGGGGGEPPPGSAVVPGDLYIHTDLFTAAGGADPLELEPRPWMPSDYGVPLVTGLTHAVIPLRVVEGDETPSQLTHARIRVADLGSDPLAPLGCFVHVRLWPGNSEPYPAMPSASVPLGGDLITDVTLAVNFSDVFCVYPGELQDERAPVKDVTIDLSHLPPLEPLAPGERYWLEIAVTPEPGREIFLPLSPYDGGDGLTPNEEASYMFFGEADLVPIQDPASGRLYTLPVVVYGASEASGCYADCDGDGDLSFFDFLCFQDAFASGSAAADCDGDGVLSFFDFLCFQNAFAGGCQ